MQGDGTAAHAVSVKLLSACQWPRSLAPPYQDCWPGAALLQVSSPDRERGLLLLLQPASQTGSAAERRAQLGATASLAQVQAVPGRLTHLRAYMW
jgi:hypothetical protein